MRILIDLQGAQSESRFRGIGRYSLALALGIARNAAGHEIWLALNGALATSIADLRRAFDGLVPAERIRVFDIPIPVAEIDAANVPRCRAAEMLREHFIEQLAPDAVLVTSLFEGYIDDSVVSAGRFAPAGHTAVVLYDLIPFLNPDAYLGTPEQRQHYAGKIASLRAAGLLLAISDYTRQEAIDALGLDPKRVVAISTAVDDSFRPAPPGPALAALRERCGIVRDTIMYAPGGFDARKNIDGLIVAYSLLPAALRARHQLVIASKLGEHERRVMNEHARQHGLAHDELVLTGYVSDTELVDLYRSAALFVFPSKHEGFGLPALEAMACGAIVIGANNTSIPEVIGCGEALFDAASPASIAAKIAEVMESPALQERLRIHGRAQAARFSWDVTARKALQALAAHHAAQHDAGAAVHAPTSRSELLRAVLGIPGLPRNEAYLHELAHCLAGAPDSSRPRQFLFDVSAIMQKSATETAAVLEAQLRELGTASLPGLQLEPVFLSKQGGRWHYRYARRLPGEAAGSPDEPAQAAIDIGPSDLFYTDGGGDTPAAEQAALHARLRERGVKLGRLAGPGATPSDWLQADAVLCTSQSALAQVEAALAGDAARPRPALGLLEPGAAPVQLPALFGAGVR
ncbi:glycosyltransferase family 4 protein [Massilia sp. SYSU DXS3249]